MRLQRPRIRYFLSDGERYLRLKLLWLGSFTADFKGRWTYERKPKRCVKKWKQHQGLSGSARSIRASDVNRQNLLFSLAWLVNSTRL